MELNRTYQLLVYADGVKEVGLEVNAGQTKYMFILATKIIICI